METVIFWRNTQNNCVGFISDDKGELAIFKNEDDAIEFAERGDSPVLKVFPYQIVVLNEL